MKVENNEKHHIKLRTSLFQYQFQMSWRIWFQMDSQYVSHRCGNAQHPISILFVVFCNGDGALFFPSISINILNLILMLNLKSLCANGYQINKALISFTRWFKWLYSLASILKSLVRKKNRIRTNIRRLF